MFMLRFRNRGTKQLLCSSGVLSNSASLRSEETGLSGFLFSFVTKNLTPFLFSGILHVYLHYLLKYSHRRRWTIFGQQTEGVESHCPAGKTLYSYHHGDIVGEFTQLECFIGWLQTLQEG